MVLIRHRAWPALVCKGLDSFVSLSLYFPTLVLPKPHWFLPFPFPKDPIVTLTIPSCSSLHLIVGVQGPYAVTALSLRGALESLSIYSLWWVAHWQWGWWLSWDSPVSIWVLPPTAGLLCAFACEDEPLPHHLNIFHLVKHVGCKNSFHTSWTTTGEMYLECFLLTCTLSVLCLSNPS